MSVSTASTAAGVSPCILRVAVDAPLAELFDYLPPVPAQGDSAVALHPGQRLLVPFGTGRRVGLLLELSTHSPLAPERLKPALAVLDPVPLLGELDLRLLRWAADYYCQPLGEVLFAALPTRLRGPEPARAVPTVAGARLTPAGAALDPAALARAPRQRQLLERLRAAPEGLAVRDLDEIRPGDSAGPLRALRDRALVTSCRVSAEAAPPAAVTAMAPRDPALPAAVSVLAPRDAAPPAAIPAMDPRDTAPPDVVPPAAIPALAPPDAAPPETASPLADADARLPCLNADQAAAVAAVLAARGTFRPFLLDGVTGSGKTEVYMRLIAAIAAAGGQALVVVPEIGLTPQLRERFRQRLGDSLEVLHSALNAGERERAWHRAARGQASLVLGTRSAIFVPLPRLALILVDEEQDPSLKQQEGFRYSARDLAVRRAQLTGCPVVLGSATPALETLRNARAGRYGWLRLPRRAGGAALPEVALLDIRDQPLRAGLSSVLRAHMERELADGNQVLLFLNRRGYAPVLTCHACGWVGDCPRCDARLTLHLRPRRFWCHHCDWQRPPPTQCPSCGSADLRMLGQGTERLEDELAPLFPETAIVRVDRDSTRRQGELARRFEQVRSGAARILLGTQMLAKGHDFPGVTLVGILDLDQSLHASDFRAPERTAQLIVQVAGRAGRAERPGRVVLQTRHPEHPLLQSLLREGYAGFAETALAERRAAELPPFAHLALLRADAPAPEVPLDFLRQARALGERLAAFEARLMGPVPAPMERRAGRHRAQLLVQCGRRAGLRAFLADWTPALRALPRTRGLRWSLDVDPLDLS